MNKKNALFMILMLVFLFNHADGQESSSLEETGTSPAKDVVNGVYLELGGNAGIYSVNYERYFLKKAIKLAGRLGFSLISEGLIIDAEDKKGLEFLMPFGVNGLYTIVGSHHIEAGVGATFYTHKVYAIPTHTSNLNLQPLEASLVRKNELWPNFTVGYRRQKSDGGFVYRVFFNGHLSRRVLADNPNRHSQYSVLTLDPWAGFSIGYAF